MLSRGDEASDCTNPATPPEMAGIQLCDTAWVYSKTDWVLRKG